MTSFSAMMLHLAQHIPFSSDKSGCLKVMLILLLSLFLSFSSYLLLLQGNEASYALDMCSHCEYEKASLNFIWQKT